MMNYLVEVVEADKALYPDRNNINTGSHYRISLAHWKKFSTCIEPELRLCWMELRSSKNEYTLKLLSLYTYTANWLIELQLLIKY